MITTNNKIPYFGFYFIRKSTYRLHFQAMMEMKISGQPFVYHYTKCAVPCVTYEYSLNPFVSQNKDYLKDAATEYLKKINETEGSILVIGHTKTAQIKTFKEIYQYTFLTFLADCGGQIGLFIGLSIWSIYSDLIDPLILLIAGRFIKNKKVDSLK